MQVEDYVKLPYTRLVRKVCDGEDCYFFGKILELDGCQSTGNTIEELWKNLDEALESYIEVRLACDEPVPTPISLIEFIRITKDPRRK
jgi:predicted RNase H-like HicB family nuclease